MEARSATRLKAVLLTIDINVHDCILRADCKHLLTFGEAVTRRRTRLARGWITRKLVYSTLVPELLAQNSALCYPED